MIIFKKLFFVFFLCTVPSLCAMSLADQFTQAGYSELHDPYHEDSAFDLLYRYFDEMITFIQKNPIWAKRLSVARERFIRSKNKDYYSTDFFGLYDESKRQGRSQIAFYYSVHFHEFLYSYYPLFQDVPVFNNFFEQCREIQQPYGTVFNQAAAELGVPTIFDSDYGHPPILLKVVKYFTAYTPIKPHYDGTVFSLFLHSTDNESLLLSAYKSSFTVADFKTPLRTLQRSIVLIPGTLLTEFSVYPTPHIVMQKGCTRYSTIAFAMRPHYVQQKDIFTFLPVFKS